MAVSDTLSRVFRRDTMDWMADTGADSGVREVVAYSLATFCGDTPITPRGYVEREAFFDSVPIHDRLFVPLETEHYIAFRDEGKAVELRGVSNQYNASTVRVGRAVELRRGYSTSDKLWGVITDVQFFDDPSEIDYHQDITPGKSKREFLESVEDTMGEKEEYVAFRIDLQDGGEDVGE